jgi:hypothetical protein
MDCFIIRVYRHTGREDDHPGEIAGLVERVGRRDNSRPFSSYRSLVKVLREAYVDEEADAAYTVDDEVSRMRVLRTAKPR